MKKKVCYLIITFTFVLNACNNDVDIMGHGGNEVLTNSSEITIKDGRITYPKWLVNTIDSVAYSHIKGVDYLYPSVFSVQGGGKEYIFVSDALNSCKTCGQLFFSLSGERIENFSEEWVTMDNLDLIWPIPTPTTKAIGAVASVYTPNGTFVNDTF